MDLEKCWKLNLTVLAIWGVDTAEAGPKVDAWCNAVTFTSYVEPRAGLEADHAENNVISLLGTSARTWCTSEIVWNKLNEFENIHMLKNFGFWKPTYDDTSRVCNRATKHMDE